MFTNKLKNSVSTIALFKRAVRTYAAAAADNQKMWELFNAAFANSILGGSYAGLTYVPASVGLTPSWGNGGSNTDLFNITDKEPVWQNIYAPSSNSVSKSFKIFLDNILSTIDDQTKQQMRQYLNDISTAGNAYKAKRDTYVQQWLESGQTSTSFDKWLVDAYGMDPLSAERSSLADANAKYSDWLKTTQLSSKGLLNALNSYDDPTNEMVLALPGGKSNNVKGYSITPSLDTTLADWNNNVNLNPVSFSVSTKDSDDKRKSMAFGGGVSYFGIFNIGGSYKQSEAFTEKNSTSVTFNVKASKTFSISQWNWFNGSMLGQYANGPFKDSKPADLEFWGAKGILSLIPQQVQIVYQPSVTIQLENSTYSEFKRDVQGSTGLQIGPFSFGAKGGYSDSHITYHDDNSSLTIEDVSKVPKIVSVKCSAPNQNALLHAMAANLGSTTIQPGNAANFNVGNYIMVNNPGNAAASINVIKNNTSNFYQIPASQSIQVRLNGQLRVQNQAFSGSAIRVDVY